jgi:cupin fold WbuC family metalloprotein
MIKITDALILEISAKAQKSPRKRQNYNFHQSNDDPLQRMLNAMEPETYVRPHKHENPDKREAFLILKGRILAVEFDDKGEITDHMILDAQKEGKGVEFPARTWHTFLSLQKGSCLYELKDGPYSEKNDKVFAEWAPEENTEYAREFNETILRKLKI